MVALILLASILILIYILAQKKLGVRLPRKHKTSTPIDESSKRNDLQLDPPIFLFSRYSDLKLSDIRRGDMVNLWVRPNTDVINVYLYGRGFHSGRGYLGSFNSQQLSRLLRTKNYSIMAQIGFIDNLKIELSDFNIENLREIEMQSYHKRIALLKKKYKPRSSIFLTFEVHQSFKWSSSEKYDVKNKPFDEICESLETSKDFFTLRDLVWLEDGSGSKISIVNRSTTDNLIRYLRAWRSDCSFEITPLKRSEGKDVPTIVWFEVKPSQTV